MTGSLTFALVGLVMLVIGIAGVAGAFESDEDTDSSSADTSEKITSDCPSDDARLSGSIETFDVPDALLVVACRTGTYEATYNEYAGVVSEPQTLALWLARGKKKYALVGTQPLNYGDSVGVTGKLPRNTTRYNRWVISQEPEGKTEPRRPTKVVKAVKF
jgi:hypothetical protein